MTLQLRKRFDTPRVSVWTLGTKKGDETDPPKSGLIFFVYLLFALNALFFLMNRSFPVSFLQGFFVVVVVACIEVALKSGDISSDPG